MQPATRVFDLRKIASACGDYTLYVLAEIDKLSSGERLKLIAAKAAKEVLDEAVKALEQAGAGRVLEKGYEDDAYYVVVEKP